MEKDVRLSRVDKGICYISTSFFCKVRVKCTLYPHTNDLNLKYPFMFVLIFIFVYHFLLLKCFLVEIICNFHSNLPKYSKRNAILDRHDCLFFMSDDNGKTFLVLDSLTIIGQTKLFSMN